MVTPAPSKTAKAGGVRLPVGKARRRTSLPLLGVGLLLMMLSVAVYGAITNQLDHRTPVLVVAQRVEAGQIIAAQDVRSVSMSNAAELGLVAAGDSAQVVGQTAAVPLAVGSVLVRSMIGEAQFPAPGQRLVSLSLKAGQYPQRLSAGAKVEVFLGVAATGAAPAVPAQPVGPAAVGAPSKVVATVYEVDSAAGAADGSSGAVVTLVLGEDAAARLAGTVGAVLLMQMPAGA